LAPPSAAHVLTFPPALVNGRSGSPRRRSVQRFGRTLHLALRDAGLAVTLSTDVPSVTGVSLREEYARVRSVFGWTDGELADLARAGVHASFAAPTVRQQLLEGIDAWLTSAPSAAPGVTPRG
jgi:hypothetical protein